MSHSVLIVDDSVTAFHQLRDMLESSGEFKVIAHATNGEDAIALYKSKRPDLVMMDLVMPGMSGIETIKHILAEDASARIVVASSMGGVRSQAVQALSSGAKNIILKPFQKERALSVVRGVLAADKK